MSVQPYGPSIIEPPNSYNYPVTDNPTKDTIRESEMRLRATIYDLVNVSSGISSSLPLVLLCGWKNLMLTDVSPSDQPVCCTSAAFFNESINRDIITGRYLERPSVGPPCSKNIKPKAWWTYTTFPLIVVTKTDHEGGSQLGSVMGLPRWK